MSTDTELQARERCMLCRAAGFSAAAVAVGLLTWMLIKSLPIWLAILAFLALFALGIAIVGRLCGDPAEVGRIAATTGMAGAGGAAMAVAGTGRKEMTDSSTCRLVCWVLAGLGGLLIAWVLHNGLGFWWILSLLLGLVVFVGLGMWLTNMVCRSAGDEGSVGATTAGTAAAGAAAAAGVAASAASRGHIYAGGCEHIRVHSDHAPIDNHTCHCSVCKSVTGQDTTHVVFFNHGELKLSDESNLNRQPFNANNPDGPLELCTCGDCGTPIMLDDKQKRIRAVVPNLMGGDSDALPADYHAYYDPSTGEPRPDDGRPVHEGLRPDFVWPAGIPVEEVETAAEAAAGGSGAEVGSVAAMATGGAAAAAAAQGHKVAGGCAHIATWSDHDPIDSHTCHCSVCKSVTGQDTTHVTFYDHGQLHCTDEARLDRQPFNANNPNGPLELCTCKDCGTPIMLDDKQERIRAIVPNLMGHDPEAMPADYHAYYDPATGVPRPDDGRPVHEGLRPDFVWPAGVEVEEVETAAEAAAAAREAEEARAAEEARKAEEAAAKARADAVSGRSLDGGAAVAGVAGGLAGAGAAAAGADDSAAREAQERRLRAEAEARAAEQAAAQSRAAQTQSFVSSDVAGRSGLDEPGAGDVVGGVVADAGVRSSTTVDVGRQPQGLSGARGGQPDDLKRIKGVGPKLEGTLNGLGYYHFDQIAAWDGEEVAWVDENLEGFHGRVTRDRWVPQAEILARGGTLGAEFSDLRDDEGVQGGVKPEGLSGPRGGRGDDLKRIKGVGPKMEEMMNGMGYYHFDQVAAWGPDEVEWVDENLEGFKGRVTRDRWVPQARVLAGGYNVSDDVMERIRAGEDVDMTDYDSDGIVEGSGEGTRPAALDGPRGGRADDLKQIKGVGPKMEKLLNSLGFYHFDQVAAWSMDEVAWVDANLEGFKGRVTRDEWVAQAKVLAAGGETEFSKRVEDGGVY